MPVFVQVADVSNNASYADLGGVLELKMSRRSQSQPGVLTLKCGTDSVLDVQKPPRFNPHQLIRVLEGTAGSAPISNRKYFEGRIDNAEMVEDEQYGRVWQIESRDWLACLADNFIDRGQWLSATVAGRGVSFNSGDPWEANYVGDWSGGGNGLPAGEYRANIIMDLAMNVLHDTLIGINTVKTATAPNSKPIEWAADNTSMLCILDAIRQIAAADPWFFGGIGGLGKVDGKSLKEAGFPDNSGFGGEFQIVMNTTSDNPQIAEYYARGQLTSGVVLTYGQEVFDPQTTHYVIEHHFAKQGTDIFSRTRVVGKGEGQYQINVGPDGAGGESTSEGTGVLVPGMETTWDPPHGLYHIRRENPNPRQQGLVGEAGYEDQDDEVQAIRARALHDGAYANLVSGAGGLSNHRGGANQGTVTVAGPPNVNTGADRVIRVGTLTSLTLPAQGFNAVSDHANAVFVIQDWTYDFPVDKTTLTLARLGFSDMGTQMLNQLTRGQDNAAAHNDYYDSGWQVSDPGGSVTLKHNLGVKPSKIQIEASLWDGSTHDPNTNPLPTFQTTVTVPPTGWDAAQGQNHGFFISRSDAEETTIKFAHWLAYSDGAGQWLTHDDPKTLVRVRVLP